MPSVQQTKRQNKVKLRDANFDQLKTKESCLFSYKPSKNKRK